jgi:hypothetical protein
MFNTSSVRRFYLKNLFKYSLTSLPDHIPTKVEQIHQDDEDQVLTNHALNNQNYPL